jgi:hypothetical protein
MTVRDLMNALEGLNPDATIEVQQQPNYPLRGELLGVCTDLELKQAAADEEDEDDGRVPGAGVEDDEELETVYLVSGAATEYGDREAWNCAG